jgi:hypothetical protein
MDGCLQLGGGKRRMGVIELLRGTRFILGVNKNMIMVMVVQP